MTLKNSSLELRSERVATFKLNQEVPKRLRRDIKIPILMETKKLNRSLKRIRRRNKIWIRSKSTQSKFITSKVVYLRCLSHTWNRIQKVKKENSLTFWTLLSVLTTSWKWLNTLYTPPVWSYSKTSRILCGDVPASAPARPSLTCTPPSRMCSGTIEHCWRDAFPVDNTI